MRRKFFWRLALTFLALLWSVLLAVDFLAERALRQNYESDSYRELQALARVVRTHPLPLNSIPPKTSEETAALNNWVANAASSGARVTIIAADGRVLADSQTETDTMETHASRPEVVQALQSGEGRAMRTSVSVKQGLMYYAFRQYLPGDVPVVVRLALPLEGIDEPLGKFRTNLWVGSLLIFLIAGAVGLLMSRTYTDRVERLREFSRRVAEGDFRPLPAGRHRRHAGSAGRFAQSDGCAPGSHHSHVDRGAQPVGRHSWLDGGRRRGGERRRTPGVRESGLRLDSWLGCAAGGGQFACSRWCGKPN